VAHGPWQKQSDVGFGLLPGSSKDFADIRHPQPLHDPTWRYAVLGAAAVFKGISFAIALRQFQRLAGDTQFWEFAHRSKDPTTHTVLAEDSAAIVGPTSAAVDIALSHWLQMPALDGAASVLIGILPAGVADLLAWQSCGRLIGEGIRPETRAPCQTLRWHSPGCATSAACFRTTKAPTTRWSRWTWTSTRGQNLPTLRWQRPRSSVGSASGFR
jgi:divalent metal cation (Fe/Co/Zn/Cd) transporter